MPDTENIKKMLSDMLAKKKADKANEDQMRQEKNDGDRNKILENVGKDFGGVIQPYIDKMGENSRMSAEEMKRIIAESVQVTAPNVDTAGIQQVLADAFANLKLPEPKVHVAAPIIPAPVIKLNSPDVKFPSSMKLTPNDKPFPVIMMDAGGKPMLFPIAGSSGPGFPMQTLDPSTNSIRVSGSFSVTASNASTQLIDSSLNAFGTAANPINVAITSGAASSTKAQIGNSDGDFSAANPLPVTFSASASQNVNLFDSQASSITSHQFATDFRGIDVFLATNSQLSTQTMTDAVANADSQMQGSFNYGFNGATWDRIHTNTGDSAGALRVLFASDATASVNVVSPIAQGDAATALRVVIAGNADASVVVNSGTITTVTTLTGITNTVTTRLDSPDGLYSAANPFPITLISGALTSTQVIGDSAARTADNGGNPVKVGGIARTTNPTAYADGDRANFATDKLGRLLTRNVQVRDLIKTAYATLSTQAETLLFGPTTSAFNDLIMLTATNASAAAWKIDIRATGGGNIIHTMNVPANTGPVGFAPVVPWPASDQGAQWTATISSGADVSNANVFLSALFSQEI